ncbi:transcription factor bHLH18-like [Bidens hawaiensis]|uniref:transcription factor bHLH18-like n=1 Tax=Bidens hawaiensis TaxID=980011 RepID=UPI00404B4966
MDLSSTWLSQQEVQDHDFMNQFQMMKPYHMVGDLSVDSFLSESNTKTPSFVNQAFEIPTNIKEKLSTNKITNNILNKLTPASENPNPNPKPKPVPDIPNTFTISFGDLKPKDEILAYSDSLDYTSGTKRGPIMMRNSIQLRDHMLAERKRREKLARRFVTLSSLLPGLKKMDKATVLEDATNYILELQCRVKELEGLSNMKTKNMQSAISAKRSKLSCSDYDDDSSYDEANVGESRSGCNPEIEVRMSSGSVLVRIYGLKNYMLLVKAHSEMQKLGLCVTSSSALPFAHSNLLITIVAKKNEDFLMTSTDLVKNLQLAFSTFDGTEVQDCHSNIARTTQI